MGVSVGITLPSFMTKFFNVMGKALSCKLSYVRTHIDVGKEKLIKYENPLYILNEVKSEFEEDHSY